MFLRFGAGALNPKPSRLEGLGFRESYCRAYIEFRATLGCRVYRAPRLRSAGISFLGPSDIAAWV